MKSYDENERFFKLLENFDKISESVQTSFKAYLQNFSYQKLELELKKDLDYFIKSINDSLSSLQTQALGLPIATALTQVNKGDNEIIVFLTLIVFSVFVAFNSFQQQKQIEYIEASIERFYDKDNVKSVVDKDEKLQNIRNLLSARIRYIQIYIRCIYGLVSIISLYSMYMIAQILKVF